MSFKLTLSEVPVMYGPMQRKLFSLYFWFCGWHHVWPGRGDINSTYTESDGDLLAG